MDRSHAYRTPRSSYMHGSAAPAFSSDRRSGFEVIPGRRASADFPTLPTSVMGVARAIVVAAILIAVLCCVRVGLVAASVTSSMAVDDLNRQISDARSYGSDLEVQQSRLSNTTHIRLEASSLNMAPPISTQAVVLAPDIVATDAEGNLSLAGSVAAIAASQQPLQDEESR